MSWQADTVTKDALAPVLVVEVQGLPYSFVEEPLAGAGVGDLGAGRTQLEVLADVSFGRSTLDLHRRQAVGGSLQVVLRDTDDHVLRGGPFRSRLEPRAWLTDDVDKADVMTGAGTLKVSTTAFIPSSGVVIVGGEAFAYTSTTASPPTLNGVTRAALDTRPQSHFGGTSFGTASQVFASPPSWEGRRVRVLSGYKRDDGTVPELALLGTWRMLGPPQPAEDGTWTIQCGEMSDWYRAAPIGLGLVEVPGPPPWDIEQGQPPLHGPSQVPLPASSVAMFRRGLGRSHVLIRQGSGNVWLGNLTSVGVDRIGITRIEHYVEGNDEGDPSNPVDGVQQNFRGRVSNATLQHVALLTGDPADIALQMLLSDEGQMENGPHDILPGDPRAGDGDNGWRMGAGLHEDDVDVAAFEALVGTSLWSWRVFLDGPTTVGDVLDELTLATGCYWYVTAEGKISIAKKRDRIAPSDAVAVLEVDDDLLIEGLTESLAHSEQEVAHSMTLAGSYDPLLDKHLVTVSAVDWDIKERFAETSKAMAHESPYAAIDGGGLARQRNAGPRLRVHSPGVGVGAVRDVLRRLQTGGARGSVEYSATLAWPAAVLGLGDVVRVTNNRLPDLEGGTLSGDLFMVVSKRPVRSRHHVEVTLRLLVPGWLWAPSAVVTGWAPEPGGGTLTLATGLPFDLTDNAPADYFATGAFAVIYDVSGGVAYAERCSPVSPTELLINGTPPFTPSPGDIVSVPLISPATDNAHGYNRGDYAYQTALDGSSSGTRLI